MVSFLQIHAQHHRLLWCHRGLTGTLCDTSRFSSSQFPKLCPRSADFGGPINARFGSAVGPDETHASTVETSCVGFAFPFTFESAVAHIIPRFGEDFLAISNFQTVHFSILAFYKFVMTGIVIAGPICSNFPYQWSRTTSVAVNDSDTLRQHLCVVWEQVLLCYQPFLIICWRIGEKYSESHIFGQLVSCAFTKSFFKALPDMENVRQIICSGDSRRGQDLPTIVRTSSSCQSVVQSS